MTSEKLCDPKKLRITNHVYGEMLDGREGDGRMVCGKEKANKILPCSR
jgi:hypothetical protein